MSNDCKSRELKARAVRALHACVARAREFDYAPGSKVLDFGCGSGALTREYLRHGFDAHGVDIKEFWSDAASGRLRVIDGKGRIPHDDNDFDFAFSQQVLEHVQDHDVAFRELSRVMKPGAASLHVFPPPWSVVEPHIFVPFAGMIRHRCYLRAWAELGVRNRYQKAMTATQVATNNAAWLETETNYRSRATIERLASCYFSTVRWVEADFLRCHCAKYLQRLPYVPGLAPVCRTFIMRALWLAEPRVTQT